eukprot:351387-Amphidinium_carterae.2
MPSMELRLPELSSTADRLFVNRLSPQLIAARVAAKMLPTMLWCVFCSFEVAGGSAYAPKVLEGAASKCV